MTDAWPIRLALVSVIVGLLGGLTIGWQAWGTRAPAAELAAPEQRLDYGAMMLERQPELSLVPDPPIRPSSPPGTKRIARLVRVVVEPKPAESPSAPNGRSIERCGPVRIDLALLEMKAGGYRVVASSPDGTIVGGVDVPLAPPEAVARSPPPNAVGVLVRGPWLAAGVFYERDIGWLRTGIEVAYRRPSFGFPGGLEAGARAGIRF